MKKLFSITLLVMMIIMPAFSQSVDSDKIVVTMREELNSSMEQLRLKTVPAYFMSLRLIDSDGTQITSSMGAAFVNKSHERYVVPMVRIGNMELDNYKFENQGTNNPGARNAQGTRVALDDQPLSVYREAIWKATMERYDIALQNYNEAVSKSQTQAENEDKSPSFSQAPAESYYEQPLPKLNIDEEKWKASLNRVTAIFKACRELANGQASVQFDNVREYIVNSDGTAVVQNRRAVRVMLSAAIKANDGMICSLYEDFFGYSEDELPGNEAYEAKARELVERLLALRDAPVADPFTGPAILSGPASGVFFHEIFGHRLESHRMKKGGETFKKMVGERVLPASFQVYCDPTMRYYGKQPLNGYYLYDDEGVKARRVDNVKDGILTEFLLGRIPIDGFPQSNGHGRASNGNDPVSRQSNLVVETKKPYTDAELRAMLIAEAKKQGKEYGYYFRSVTGGYTLTEGLNSFNVTPLEVYRVFVDGRKDELVRGVSLIGTPLNMFSNVEAAGDTPSTFTGFCGAESGWVPVTGTSPAIYVSKIETQRDNAYKDIPHPLPSPEYVGNDAQEAGYAPGSKEEEELIFSVMQDEMKRTMDSLKIEGQSKPFKADYRVVRRRVTNMVATHGGLTSVEVTPVDTRGSVSLYIGNNKISSKDQDNEYGESGSRYGGGQQMTYDAMRRYLWEANENAYKTAIRAYYGKQSRMRTHPLPEEDIDIPEMMRVPAKEYIAPSVLQEEIDTALQRKIVTELSAIFAEYPQMYGSSVQMVVNNMDIYRLTSEGVKIRVPYRLVTVNAITHLKAADGYELGDSYEVIEATVSDLPSMEELKQKVRDLCELSIQEWKGSTVKEYYVGPILIEENAAANEMLGFVTDNCIAKRRIFEGSSTASMMLGKRISDTKLNIHQLGDITEYKGRHLIGADVVDMDGIAPAKDMPVVENGILRNLICGHNPAVGAMQSTGNERIINAPFGTSSVSPGVLRVSYSKSVSAAKIKKMLLAEAKKAGLDHAYILRSHYDNMYVLVRVDVKTGEEEIVRADGFPHPSRGDLMHVVAASQEEYICNTMHRGALVSMISPKMILVESMEIKLNRPSRGDQFQLRKPAVR